MLKIKDELDKYNIKPYKYTKKNNTMIVDTEDGSYVFKENHHNNIYKYLNSRSFNYYPEILSSDTDSYEITRYIEQTDMPDEQKVTDMIDIVSLLHNKTTHYKEIDENEIKTIYEDISNNIEYLYSYYNDVMTIIESKVFMSPAEYLLACSISKVYDSLNYCKTEINNWYKLVKDKKKERLVVLHNNLSLDHFIRSDKPYLISWDKAKIDIPIFDLYKLYKNHSMDFDFSEVLKRYEKEYPLSKDERMLLFILMALPDKIEFNCSNYNMCIKINKVINELVKTQNIISPYYSEYAPQDKKPPDKD